MKFHTLKKDFFFDDGMRFVFDAPTIHGGRRILISLPQRFKIEAHGHVCTSPALLCIVLALACFGIQLLQTCVGQLTRSVVRSRSSCA